MKILDLLSRRHHRRGDLCDGGRSGSSRQISLQEKRDVSEPGSKNHQTTRWARLPLQQPGRVPEGLRGKPEGVFYISAALTSVTVGFLSRRWRQGTSCHAFGLHSQSCWVGSGSTKTGGGRETGFCCSTRVHPFNADRAGLVGKSLYKAVNVSPSL